MAGTPPRRADSRVRTEHDLRTQLRIALERSAKMERALAAVAAYVYGRRAAEDLRRVKAVLSSAGFPDPERKPAPDEHDPV